MNSTPDEDEQLSVFGRIANSLLNRRIGLFAAELVLVIAGVLIALAVDGWISDARDRQTEMAYLELLVRDIDGIQQQALLQIEFEQERIDAAAGAYAALTSADPQTKREEITSAMALLISRRTISLSSATYDQMVSSGHLQLIKNHELRNRVVNYFASMERTERITDNNNRELIDDVFVPFVMQSGITALQPPGKSQVTATLARANEIAHEQLGTEFTFPADRILLEPADAESWNDIRRNVIFRLRIAAAGQALAEGTVNQTLEISAAIEAELAARQK